MSEKTKPRAFGTAPRNYRQLQAGVPGAQSSFDGLLEFLQQKLTDPATDRNLLCRDLLCQLYEGGGRWDDLVKAAAGQPARLAALHCYDPRNITLEPEHYQELDVARFERVKPLMWLWIMFDRSPVGQNALLGIPFRRVLAQHVFKKCGQNVKIWHNVEFSFGYNLSVGDNVVLHRYVLIDDRGEVIIGNNVSVSDYVNIYSHSHSIEDIKIVTTHQTVIEDNVRLTYHSTVLSGTRIGREGMLGAMALLSRDIQPYHVHVGIPAKSVKVKEKAKQ